MRHITRNAGEISWCPKEIHIWLKDDHLMYTGRSSEEVTPSETSRGPVSLTHPCIIDAPLEVGVTLCCISGPDVHFVNATYVFPSWGKHLVPQRRSSMPLGGTTPHELHVDIERTIFKIGWSFNIFGYSKGWWNTLVTLIDTFRATRVFQRTHYCAMVRKPFPMCILVRSVAHVPSDVRLQTGHQRYEQTGVWRWPHKDVQHRPPKYVLAFPRTYRRPPPTHHAIENGHLRWWCGIGSIFHTMIQRQESVRESGYSGDVELAVPVHTMSRRLTTP